MGQHRHSLQIQVCEIAERYSRAFPKIDMTVHFEPEMATEQQPVLTRSLITRSPASFNMGSQDQHVH